MQLFCEMLFCVMVGQFIGTGELRRCHSENEKVEMRAEIANDARGEEEIVTNGEKSIGEKKRDFECGKSVSRQKSGKKGGKHKG